MKKSLTLLLLSILFVQGLSAQSITLYSQGSANWNSPNIWNTQRNGSGAPFTDPNNTIGPTGPIYQIIIQAGHTIILNDTKGISTIIVETGGKIYRNSGSNRYLEIYGSNVQVNGIMGNSGIHDGLGIEIQSPYCAIQGDGEITLSRLRKQAFVDTNLDILSDITLTYTGAALYNDIEGYAFNVNIPSGVKVKVTSGDVSIDGVDGTNNSNRWGTFSINGTLDVGRNLYVTTDNAVSGVQDVSYFIGAGGHVLVKGQVVGNDQVGGLATAGLYLAGSALLSVSGPGEVFQNIHGTRDIFLLQSGSEVDYAGSNVQFIEDEFIYAKISINGGSEKILEGQVLVNETLFLNSGYPTLNNHNLIINTGGNIIGGSESAFVKTNGNGKLIQNVDVNQVNFPIGVHNYTPISLVNSGIVDLFAIRVSSEVLENAWTGSPMTNDYVNCTWFVEELSPGGSHLDIGVQWSSINELPFFDRNNSYVTFYQNPWDAIASSPAQGVEPFQQSRNALMNPAPISVSSSVQLPIELKDFIAEQQSESIHLTWETISEQDNDRFEIERSNNGKDYSILGQVKGSGTTNLQQSYSYIDHYPEVGLNYYRLKQIDFNGQFSYSPIQVLNFESDMEAWEIGPNPVKSFLVLKNYTEKGIISIINSLGQEVQRLELAAISESGINLSHLERGYYYISIKSPNGIFSKSFFKL